MVNAPLMDIEYGTERIEIHTDAVLSGDRVLLIDDLIATVRTLREFEGE